MQFLKSLVLIFSILLFSCPVFGQEVPPKANDKAQQEPYIAGEWSEPVNGIRMMAKFIHFESASEQFQILVFLQNCSEKEVAVPPLDSERFLVFKNSELEQLAGGNLRIVAEPLDGQKFEREGMKVQGLGMQRLEAALQPGEIRLHGISVRTVPEAMQILQHANQNTVRSDTVYGPELSNPNSEGRWRFSLSYRPDEQFPVDDKNMDRELADVPEEWKDVQIDLPPLELDWVPPAAQRTERLSESIQR